MLPENLTLRNSIWSANTLWLHKYRNSYWLGTKGIANNFMRASSGTRSAFLLLQRRQEVTTFVQISFPPLERGFTWSLESSCTPNFPPQYKHMFWSRRKRNLFSNGGPKNSLCTLPSHATILGNLRIDCSPCRLKPPLISITVSPSDQMIKSLTKRVAVSSRDSQLTGMPALFNLRILEFIHKTREKIQYEHCFIY